MKPITIKDKTRQRLQMISAEIQRLTAERNGLLDAVLEMADVTDAAGWQVTSDFSQLIPPQEAEESKGGAK